MNRLARTCVCLLVLFLVACGRAAQAVPATPTSLPTPPPTNTPRPTATPLPPSPTPAPPTATLTVTPLPPTATPLPASATPPPTGDATALPTEAAPPSARIQEAQRLMRDGDYAAAAAAYTAILEAPADLAEAADARYGLGEARLRDGDFAGAAEALNAFMTQYPQDPRVADAWFLVGDARQGAGDPAGAISAYQSYLAAAADDNVAPYAQERIGDAYLAQNDPVQAVAAYEAALTGASGDLAISLHEKAGRTYAALGNVAKAVAHYDANLALSGSSFYQAKMNFLAGQAALSAGQTEAGYARFLTLVANYPASADAYQALIALVNAGVPVDDFQRGLVDFYAQAYTPAVEAFNRYIASGKTEYRADAHFFNARAYAGLGNTAAALTELDTLLNAYPTAARWGDAWLEKASILASAGDIAGALATYRAFADQAPQNPLAPEALWRAGLLADTDGDTATAGALFRDLAARFPASEQAPEGLWRAAFSAYRQGDTATAAQTWTALAAHPGGGERSVAAEFWLGQLARRNGDHNAAAEHFAKAQALAPGSYYALRAADLVVGREQALSQPIAFNLTADAEAEQAEAERWLAARLALPKATGLSALSPALAADGRLRRGEALWRLGLYSEARAELESLRQAYSQDGLASYQLALRFRDLGLYRSSIIAAASAVRLAGATPASAPRFLARLIYPTYYADLIVPQAQKYGLDPLLLFALVYQESLFESFSTSYAQAQGLMQVIPATGTWIAQQLNWPDYQNQDLYRPYISIIFGTYYLAAQRDRFDGDLYAALAAYNAGPGRSAAWRQQAEGDQDLFFELISLDQPQTYIQRITEHYAIYRALYPK